MGKMAALRSALFVPAAIVAVPLLLHVVVIETRDVAPGLSPAGLARLGAVGFAAVAHWMLYAGLLSTFALTLRRGRTPLITAMASRMLGGVSDEVRVYTRKVTIAWTLFFAAQLATSVSLACFASLTAWSTFVNLLDLPLVAAMFALEYCVRIAVLRDPPRHSLSAIVTMARQCARGPAAAAAATPASLPEVPRG